MTAEQPLAADLPSAAAPAANSPRWSQPSGPASRLVEPQAEQLASSSTPPCSPSRRAPGTCSRSACRCSAAGCCGHWCTSCRWSTNRTTCSRSSPARPRPPQVRRARRALRHRSAWRCSPRWRSSPGRRWTDEVRQAVDRCLRDDRRGHADAATADDGPPPGSAAVVEHRRIGWNIAVITVRPPEPMPYRPGQYVSVETPQRPRLWRYLSPANAPREDGLLEFHVRAVAEGWVSRALVTHTRLGDTWRIGPPMGRMTVDRESEPRPPDGRRRHRPTPRSGR